jgi:putative lipoprotein
LIFALALLGACGPSVSTETAIIGPWRVEDVNSGGVIDSSRLEIQFDAGGRVFGHAGCNTFTGQYTRNRAAIDIGPLASTERACADALMLQEARVLHSLGAVTAPSS